MKKDWIKLPVDILHNPKYGTLTDDDWRLMIQLNLLAGEMDLDGLLPHMRDIAWMLHTGPGTLQISLHHLCERGLVHSTPQGWVVTGFKESQAAPNSTERTRAFRKRRRSATQDEDESNEEATQKRTYGATEMQLSRHIPVSKPVPAPDRDPAQPGRPRKSRRRRKAKGQPVENTEDTHPQDKCPVDTYPVEKGWKFSAPSPGTISTSNLIKYLSTSSLTKNLNPITTSSNSSLIKYLKPGLNLKLLLLVDQADLKVRSEKFRPSQEKTLENRLNAPGNALFAAERQVAPGWSGQASRAAAENLRVPVDTCPMDTYPMDTYPVDKPVDNSVEKGRKISDPTPGTTSSNSSLIKYLIPGLNLNLLLVVDQADLKIKTEIFRPSQEKTLENRLNAPGSAPFATARQVAPGGSGQASRAAAENLRVPVDTCPMDTYPVDKPVDNSVEKGRKISDPDGIPP